MLGRRVLGTAVALAAALSLVACVPSPAPPTPTPTQLTDAEAYAAAEEAFRAYIDALNQIDIADPATFEPAFALTTGELNAQDRKQYSEWHADSYSKVGDASIDVLQPQVLIDAQASAELATCLNVSKVDILDATGRTVIAADRVEVQTVTVNMKRSPSGMWQVESLSPRSGDPSCKS